MKSNHFQLALAPTLFDVDQRNLPCIVTMWDPISVKSFKVMMTEQDEDTEFEQYEDTEFDHDISGLNSISIGDNYDEWSNSSVIGDAPLLENFNVYRASFSDNDSLNGSDELIDQTDDYSIEPNKTRQWLTTIEPEGDNDHYSSVDFSKTCDTVEDIAVHRVNHAQDLFMRSSRLQASVAQFYDLSDEVQSDNPNNCDVSGEESVQKHGMEDNVSESIATGYATDDTEETFNTIKDLQLTDSENHSDNTQSIKSEDNQNQSEVSTNTGGLRVYDFTHDGPQAPKPRRKLSLSDLVVFPDEVEVSPYYVSPHDGLHTTYRVADEEESQVFWQSNSSDADVTRVAAVGRGLPRGRGRSSYGRSNTGRGCITANQYGRNDVSRSSHERNETGIQYGTSDSDLTVNNESSENSSSERSSLDREKLIQSLCKGRVERSYPRPRGGHHGTPQVQMGRGQDFSNDSRGHVKSPGTMSSSYREDYDPPNQGSVNVGMGRGADFSSSSRHSSHSYSSQYSSGTGRSIPGKRFDSRSSISSISSNYSIRDEKVTSPGYRRNDNRSDNSSSSVNRRQGTQPFNGYDKENSHYSGKTGFVQETRKDSDSSSSGSQGRGSFLKALIQQKKNQTSHQPGGLKGYNFQNSKYQGNSQDQYFKHQCHNQDQHFKHQGHNQDQHLKHQGHNQDQHFKHQDHYKVHSQPHSKHTPRGVSDKAASPPKVVGRGALLKYMMEKKKMT
ncbi:hypothetical protein M8J77_008439 [Diaphorina citri]|nr:hypothetical protein M8J77_008439 [Diaphorina citri]